MNGCEDPQPRIGARNALATIAAAATLIAAHAAAGHGAGPPLVSASIYDRTTGIVLDAYSKDGQRYVVGTPRHEYAIRIRNHSRGRILAEASVDGVNVVTGETASPDQSGYVIEAGGSLEIEGWRTSLERTSAFYFTDLGDSYAARTGRPQNVGVIGVAVFRERTAPVAYRTPRDRIAAADSATAQRGEAPGLAAAQANAAQGTATEAGDAAGIVAPESPAPEAKLGTGFGRNEASYAQRVRFERASDAPAETVVIQYDRRENLIAMGVLPPPRYAERTPDPFPAMRFVPAPR